MTDELKKADEIVRALRDYASDCDGDEACFQCTFAWVCDKFDNNAPKIIADLIESLTAQLFSSQRRADAAVEEVCRRCPDGDVIDGLKHYPCDRCKWRGPQEEEKGEAE